LEEGSIVSGDRIEWLAAEDYPNPPFPPTIALPKSCARPLLIMSLGFFGSFGHWDVRSSQWRFFAVPSTETLVGSSNWPHLLNLGRIVSYALVGALIGALGSVLIAGEITGIVTCAAG